MPVDLGVALLRTRERRRAQAPRYICGQKKWLSTKKLAPRFIGPYPSSVVVWFRLPYSHILDQYLVEEYHRSASHPGKPGGIPGAGGLIISLSVVFVLCLSCQFFSLCNHSCMHLILISARALLIHLSPILH